jgi:APA family basic amino acid/polyamine antiporter
MTVVCVGVGTAIGSGVFRTPGDVAQYVRSPWIILGLWVVAGFITLMQSLVTAELATRFPRAGGEYQFLKEAYGDFAAFFFGWSCTVFIIGCGAATIAAALGDFCKELLHLRASWASPLFGCLAIVSVACVNIAGLRVGAVTQNLLTLLKAVALLVIAGLAVWLAGRVTPAAPLAAAGPRPELGVATLLLAFMPVFWPYTGATDAIRLAEEVKDVRRALPRALFTTVAVLTGVYLLYNYALLCALPPDAMAGQPSVHTMALAPLQSDAMRVGVLAASIVICLGSIGSIFLASVRVTYAMARDGLTFRALGRMSRVQAPVASFVVIAVIACAFVASRSFGGILRIYFLASAVLFGLTYLSLIVFRVRDRRAGRSFPAGVYRAPVGGLQVSILILLELAIAASIIRSDWQSGSRDSLMTLTLLAGMALFYVVWKRWFRG